MRRMSVLSITGVAVLAAVTSACGVSVKGGANSGSGTSLTSQQQLLANAYTKLGQADSLKADFHIDVSSGLMSKLDATAPSQMDAAIADKVFGSHIVVSESADVPLATVTNPTTQHEAFDVAVVSGGSSLIEIRYVAGNIYVRADVATIASLSGQSLSTLQGQLSSAPAQVQQWAQAFINGDWLEVGQSQLTMLETLLQSQSGGAAGGASNLSPSQLKQYRQQLSDAIEGVFAKDVTVTDKGSTSKGEQLVLSGDARNTVTDLVTKALPILEKVSPSMSANTDLNKVQQGLTQVPHKTVTANAYVTNGYLSEMSVDAAQFVPPADSADFAGQNMTFTMDFTPNTGSVSAPSGATQLDLTTLLSQLGASMKL